MRCPHCHEEITPADLRRSQIEELSRSELISRIEQARAEGAGSYRTGRSWSKGKERGLGNRSTEQLRRMYLDTLAASPKNGES